MNRTQAEGRIRSVFKSYGATSSTTIAKLRALSDGKVFELWVLSKLLEEIKGLGYTITYSHPGSPLFLKGAPGMLRQAQPHFDVRTAPSRQIRWQVFLSVEFRTLGASMFGATGLSSYHEIDVGVFRRVQPDGRPPHDDVVLAIECKAVGKSNKNIVRSALGLRRELSFLSGPLPSAFDPSQPVHADPPSVVRLVCAYCWIDNYRESPSVYSVDLSHSPP